MHATATTPNGIRDKEEAQTEWEVLVVSADMENRKVLLRALDRLAANTFLAGTAGQARELLAQRAVDVVFCEEFLPDGSYHELLEQVRTKREAIRFVVTLHCGEWDEYLEAMRLGATDILRCPLQSVDVEIVLIRASHNRDRRSFEMPIENRAAAHAAGRNR